MTEAAKADVAAIEKVSGVSDHMRGVVDVEEIPDKEPIPVTEVVEPVEEPTHESDPIPIPGFALGCAYNVLFKAAAIGGGRQGPESAQVGNDYAVAQPMYGPDGTYAHVSWTKDYFSAQLHKEIVGKAERALLEAKSRLAKQRQFLKEMQDRPDGIDPTHEANMQANIAGAEAAMPGLQRAYDEVKDLPTATETHSADVKMSDLFERA